MQGNSESVAVEADWAAKTHLQTAFDLCVRKTRTNIRRLADDPRSGALAVDGNLFGFKEQFFEIGNWTSSFFTGMALIAWQKTGDEYFLQQVLRLAPLYHEKIFTQWLDTHHDVGFLYSLYSLPLYGLTHDKAHREVGLRAADVLAQRYNPKGKFIRAWGRMDTTEHDNMAIIDCMMNLPLLYWASAQTGDARYRDIAVSHADSVLQHFVRPDDSVCHAFRWDLATGKPLGPDNYCGYSVQSYWARGTAWAIYGFALSYRYTRDRKYLDASLRMARRFIEQLDTEVVPVWDFRLPPGEPRLRDASAASIVVCGFQELERHQAADAVIVEAKTALLNRICSEQYLNFDDSCAGVQRKGQVGDKERKAKNAYTSWGDYFLMEALATELYDIKICW